jgi:hypothetical protein
MAKIICGHFDISVKADAALQELLGAGFTRNEVDSFYTPPPGQNNLTGFGAAIGAAIGAAALAFLALGAVRLGWLPGEEFAIPSVLFAAGLGGYVGSFMGAMLKMRPGTRRNATTEHPVETPAGRMIAVLSGAPDSEDRIIALLRRHGARKVFKAEGTWRNGSWLDFDPRSPLAAV